MVGQVTARDGMRKLQRPVNWVADRTHVHQRDWHHQQQAEHHSHGKQQLHLVYQGGLLLYGAFHILAPCGVHKVQRRFRLIKLR